MARLTKEEWKKLDELLSKHGFGGYYDLVECLKMALSKITGKKDLPEIRDLPTVVKLLMNVRSPETS
ncbi:MAG: hypothetical protein OEW69_08465 [Nitrospirota bacterium]|nr:hypothetical protein [Nitrospirota bacterium]